MSGGEVGAKAASLTIMVGGEEKAFERAKPVFEKMGKNITLVGANGVGQTTKVANQIVVALTIEAVAEALVFASKAGADPAKVRQALMGGLAASRILEVHGERMIKRTLRAGLPHRTAPEGSEPRAGRREGARRVAAEHLDHAAAVQFMRGEWRREGRSFRAGEGAGADGRARRGAWIDFRAALRRTRNRAKISKACGKQSRNDRRNLVHTYLLRGAEVPFRRIKRHRRGV